MRRIKTVYAAMAVAVALTATACNGILSDIYDEPRDSALGSGQLVVDATSWHDWYYIDFDSLAAIAATGDSAALAHAETSFTPYPIPTALTTAPTDTTTGMYTYWFDVFGRGLDNYDKRAFTPTDAQPEPAHWSIAVHRNNVRTNGGAVFETNYSSIADLPPTGAAFASATFTPDEWSERDVWVDQSQMLRSLIGCQGIMVNKVLSSWIKVAIPPMPPAFTGNSHVFIIRFPNGKMAAVQLANYISPKGAKCWLTINYKYPY